MPTQTSMQINSSIASISPKKTIRVVDIPGHPRLRNQILEHLADAKVVGFVIDASTVSRNGPAVAEYVLSLNWIEPKSYIHQTSPSRFACSYLPTAVTIQAFVADHCAQIWFIQGDDINTKQRERTSHQSRQDGSWTRVGKETSFSKWWDQHRGVRWGRGAFRYGRAWMRRERGFFFQIWWMGRGRDLLPGYFCCNHFIWFRWKKSVRQRTRFYAIMAGTKHVMLWSFCLVSTEVRVLITRGDTFYLRRVSSTNSVHGDTWLSRSLRRLDLEPTCLGQARGQRTSFMTCRGNLYTVYCKKKKIIYCCTSDRWTRMNSWATPNPLATQMAASLLWNKS